jgi:hypothetical protein
LVFHSADAFRWFETKFMPTHNLAWSGKRRKYNACYQTNVTPPQIIVDVFASDLSAITRRFAVDPRLLVKPIDNTGWLPTAPALLVEKLRVLPLRGNKDAGQKRFKDAIDAWALIFHNTSGDLPSDLRDTVPPGVLERALAEALKLTEYAQAHGVYADELAQLLGWLQRD